MTEAASSTRASLLGGSLVDAVDSPVLYLRAPQGSCTATAIGSRLAVTARHCVARMASAGFKCTTSGDLVLDGTGAGEIGTDYSPETLHFFTAAHLGAGLASNAVPDAVGAKIVSTNTTSACRDDLAFVVLDRDLTGLAIAPVRADAPTRLDESASVIGYGVAEKPGAPALRMRSGVSILGIGADEVSKEARSAPIRALNLAVVTCLGDSGGPVISDATGEVIGVVSSGIVYDSSPFCDQDPFATTFAVRIGAYGALARFAFAEAGFGPLADSGVTEAGALDFRGLADSVIDSPYDSDPAALSELDGTVAADVKDGDEAVGVGPSEGDQSPVSPPDAESPLLTGASSRATGCSLTTDGPQGDAPCMAGSFIAAAMTIARKRRR